MRSRSEISQLADEYRTGLAVLRAHAHRHEPRRVRLPGRRVRAHPGGDHRVGPRCRAERATAVGAEGPGGAARGHDDLHRGPGVPEGGRDARGGGRACRPPSSTRSKGLTDDEVAAGDDYGSQMRENLSTLRGRRLAAPDRTVARAPAGVPLLEASGVSFAYGRTPGARSRRPPREPGGVRGARRPQRLRQVDAGEAAARLAHADGGRGASLRCLPAARAGSMAPRIRAAAPGAGIGGARDGRGDRGHRPPRETRVVASAPQRGSGGRATRVWSPSVWRSSPRSP